MTKRAELADNAVIEVGRSRRGSVYAFILLPTGQSIRLPHVVRHSPTGFEYGGLGSGPADLALSILVACVGPLRADAWYQAFRHDRIATETADHWTMTVETVREWVEAHERVAMES